MPTPPRPRRPGGAPRPGDRGPTVVVVTGGDPPHADLVLPAADLVVAADSGARLAEGLGLGIDVVVGDMDSIGDDRLAALVAAGTVVERHHPDKDATDVELALDAAVAHDPARLVLVGGHGGRLDHALATVGAVAAVAVPGRLVEAWMGPAQVLLAIDAVEVQGRPGELVSLVPVGGDAAGVETEGLRWPLAGATLLAGTTWGVSNEMSGPTARVRVASGTLAVIRPHALDPAADRRPAVPDRPAGPRRPEAADREASP